MYKWMFDRLVDEYKKEPIEKVVGRLVAMEYIECKDRAFANQCEAGNSIYNLNEFFKQAEALCNAKTENERLHILETFKQTLPEAKGSYNYIRRSISEINDNSRYYKETSEVLSHIENAKEDDDVI